VFIIKNFNSAGIYVLIFVDILTAVWLLPTVWHSCIRCMGVGNRMKFSTLWRHTQWATSFSKTATVWRRHAMAADCLIWSMSTMALYVAVPLPVSSLL